MKEKVREVKERVERINLEQLQECFAIQREFDERVFASIGRVATLAERNEALLVELSEWYNTLEVHKYWKTNKGKPLEVQLDEAADCMAFMFSLLHSRNIDAFEFSQSVNDCIPYHMDTPLNLYSLYGAGLERVFNLFLSHYGWEAMYKAYIDKMVINHERQDNSY